MAETAFACEPEKDFDAFVRDDFLRFRNFGFDDFTGILTDELSFWPAGAGPGILFRETCCLSYYPDVRFHVSVIAPFLGG